MNTTSFSATSQPLLVELFTEELPPKALERLGVAFAEGLQQALANQNLLAPGCQVRHFATPRRLGVLLSNILGQAPEQPYTEKLMPAKIGLTPEGTLSPALAKKLAAKGLEHLTAADLIVESDGKQDYLHAQGVAAGASLPAGLQHALDDTLAKLPIPKVMRYQLADGVTSVRFVRPAHRLVALWGETVVPVNVLGLNAGRETFGHRFQCKAPLQITSATTYEDTLRQTGKVIASFQERRQSIHDQLLAMASALNATIGDTPEARALLDEVTALVEYPTVYVGHFEEQFLQVPPECLILTMRLNQKYFPLFEPGSGKLTHRFLIVSNMQVDDPTNIIEGNQRVVRPRLADARFFYETDRKQPLASRVDDLETRVYHNKLGSQRARTERVRAIAARIAAELGADAAHVDRAALLAKADLGSSMVGEFPELQGIMGAYYAHADNEPAPVVTALRNQYLIRLDQPVSPGTLAAAVLFMADRLETLVGIWGIGLVPTGERDPYGLRRAALGIISAYEQLLAGGLLALNQAQQLSLPLLLEVTASTFPAGVISTDTMSQVNQFILERYRNQLATEFDRSVVDAVLALAPPVHQVQARVQACSAFALRPEAVSLAAANKRITNLLKKADDTLGAVDLGRLSDPAEKVLASVIQELGPRARSECHQGNFAASLSTMADARDAVDAFFNDVMVMADDPAVRANRLALLNDLHGLMNQVADISRLAQ